MKTIDERLRDVLRQYVYNDKYIGDKKVDQALSSIKQVFRDMVGEDDLERICEQVHKAYCKYHIEQKGTEYWTKGDYSKLNEEGKEYDRRTVRAVLAELRQKAVEK